MTTKFFIRVGKPWTKPAVDGTDWGYARTLDGAMKRAEKLSRKIRTDCPIFITDGQTVLASSGVNSGPGGCSTRQLHLPDSPYYAGGCE